MPRNRYWIAVAILLSVLTGRTISPDRFTIVRLSSVNDAGGGVRRGPASVDSFDSEILFPGDDACGNLWASVFRPKYRDAAPPLTRGMRPGDDRVLRKFAKAKNKIILMIRSNDLSAPHLDLDHFRAKPSALKMCKSAINGPHPGVVACNPANFGTLAEWDQAVEWLEQAGYEVLGPKDGYIVRGKKDGMFYFSDYDLQGVYSGSTGADAYTYELRAALNKLFGKKMIRHAPLDNYTDREKIGLKFPITAYLPDGSAVDLMNQIEMKQFYAEHHIRYPWKDIDPLRVSH